MSHTAATDEQCEHVLPEIKPPEAFCLPVGYRQQRGNFTLDAARGQEPYWNAWRLSENAKYQYYVYRWAASLIKRHGWVRVLDVGCGPAVKLQQFIVPALEANARATTKPEHNTTLCGIDQASATEVARHRCAFGQFLTVDLESPDVAFENTFDLIICADVIEHLVDPDPVLNLMRKNLAEGGKMLISTPDRERERGRDCMESNKPEHVREWSREEFVSYLTSRGLCCHVSRRFPKADLPIGPMRALERAYQRKAVPRSPLCCHAVLCS